MAIAQRRDTFRPSRLRWCLSAPACAILLWTAAGCGLPKNIQSKHRYERGIVLVLPGIEGSSVWNRNIALGLDDGGVTSAIEIHDWTVGVPGSLVVNLTLLERNRKEAQRLAERITEYQDRHPHSPVHLVGHSGGAGIAVMALEALPDGRRVERAILLAPALSPTYDLATALRRTRFGICNFFSSNDVSLLVVGTSLVGPIDREFGISAGAIGFRPPQDASGKDRALYDNWLRQVRWTSRMKLAGADGSHLGWASRRFAAEYLAPIIKETEAARPLPTSRVNKRSSRSARE
jgi:pimeloyl-ACP methyl ester carboxylesterase